MSASPELPDDLPALLTALLDGTLGDAQRRRLADLLRHDAHARAYYLEYVYTHALLRWELGEPLPLPGLGLPAAAKEPAPAAPPALSRTAAVPRSSGRRWPRWAAAAAALVAAVGLAYALLATFGPRPAPQSAPPVAVLVECHDAVWEGDHALPTAAGAALPPGRLKLREGVAQVRFHSGAVVWLEGPAEFVLEDANHGQLVRGRLTALVPDKAHGFTVAGPGVVVRDLGTEFGMQVDATGRTEVEVFEGEVEAALNAAAAEPVRIVQDRAARLDPALGTIRELPPNTVGAVTQVDLSERFSRVGIVNDGLLFAGTKFAGGLDGVAHAYSAELLGPVLTADGLDFRIGPPGVHNAVGARGKAIVLPPGRYRTLALLGTGVNGAHPDQNFTVQYTDGSKVVITQGLSDWLEPNAFAGESVAATLGYRNKNDGTADPRACHVYLYRFPLDRSKTVRRVVLPNNPGVAILAVDFNSLTRSREADFSHRLSETTHGPLLSTAPAPAPRFHAH